MTARIELDTVRKYRNDKEWRNVNRATCGQYEATGDGKVIEQISRAMMENGETGQVEVWRAGTMCFAATPVEIWASGKAGKQEQPAHLRKLEGVQ
jgi:hypothetical protein